MSAPPLDFGASPPWQRGLIPIALLLSLLGHAALAAFAFQERPEPERRDTWVEMTVATPPPPPPPPEAPPPPPEPPPPPPAAKKVRFTETTPDPPPTDTPPPPPDKQVRRVQGLSASSFAPGSGSGLQARAGTTLSAGAGPETLSLAEAQGSVPYAAVTGRPRCSQPQLVVPDSVIEAQVEGQVKVSFDVDAAGQVRNVRLTRGLHPDADAACLAAWASARCKPGTQAGAPVEVTGMPFFCTFKAIE